MNATEAEENIQSANLDELDKNALTQQVTTRGLPSPASNNPLATSKQNSQLMGQANIDSQIKRRKTSMPMADDFLVENHLEVNGQTNSSLSISNLGGGSHRSILQTQVPNNPGTQTDGEDTEARGFASYPQGCDTTSNLIAQKTTVAVSFNDSSRIDSKLKGVKDKTSKQGTVKFDKVDNVIECQKDRRVSFEQHTTMTGFDKSPIQVKRVVNKNKNTKWQSGLASMTFGEPGAFVN